MTKIGDGQIHRFAKDFIEEGFPMIGPRVAVLGMARLVAGDVDESAFWLRFLRALLNLEQVEPDAGAALH